MKLILFSGDHPRHLFVNKTALEFFDEVFIVIMQREELLPKPPNNLGNHDKKLFKLHFENRHHVESSVYGNLNAYEVFKSFNSIFIKPNELNTKLVADKVKEFNADFCFIFGVDLILDPVIDVLPKDKINLHLGLSPWYKGGATLFWPFYHLEPQFCGSTFHQITRQADAGEIIHQCVPELLSGDKIHDVGARCVVKARDDLRKLLMYWKCEQGFKGVVQRTSGRNWRGVDFYASQLRVIYDLYQDKIVDSYLSGELSNRKPKLVSCID
jgi:folate-dependent phosphoribosylglycinamide formyltransferase PurN